MSEYIPYSFFGVWATSLRRVFSNSIHLHTKFKCHCFLQLSSTLLMWQIFIIHSLVEEHLGCFQILAVTNNAAMDIVQQMSLQYDWAYFGYMFKSVIARSWGRLILSFLRNHHTDFKSGVQICIPTSNGRVFSLLYILSSLSYHWQWY